MPKIDRDLEAICLKCLEKDPVRRYSSAEALAEDLERWLRLEPIAARPTTLWEKTVKWIRRKPVISALLRPSWPTRTGKGVERVGAERKVRR